MIDLSVFETKAVIIKTQDFKENDKLVWFYTEKLGKITAVVRGAKRSKVNFWLLHCHYVMENIWYIKARICIHFKKEKF